MIKLLRGLLIADMFHCYFLAQFLAIFFITVGRSYIEREPIEMSALKKELADVRLGGLWSPLDCIPKAKVIFFKKFSERRNKEHDESMLIFKY